MSKIFFFRHAQASLGADNYDVLSKKGELQALELGKYLVKKKYLFDKIYVGSLQRQQHTYEIVSEFLKKIN
jgi:broad specificity phosphatase PhoE